MKRLLLLLIIVVALAACGNDASKDIGIIDNSEEEIEISVPYDTIDIEDIEDYVTEGYIVADVREIDEFESGHIPNAIHAPLSDLEKGEFGPLKKDQPYVIICRSGNRSIAASNILIEEGFDIVNVSEGMTSWTGELKQ